MRGVTDVPLATVHGVQPIVLVGTKRGNSASHVVQFGLALCSLIFGVDFGCAR